MGAPEFILKEQYEKYKTIIDEAAKSYRVICLAYCKEELTKQLPEKVQVIGFIFIMDKIRKEAKQTLEYFRNQGVEIKIISGDNPITVAQIAKETGVKNSDRYVDVSKLNNEEIKEAVKENTIFGRVSPAQKKELVKALKEQGKMVAMTGDGVNDVLALKESDCSIVMANGSDAAKNVAELILLDSNFASMPKIVAEGRRTINNIERSASLFLTKTIYSCIMAILFILIGQEYPFMPVQLSLISICTIGLPSFLLALEPNKERVSGNFLKNVIKTALPTAVTVIISVIAISISHGHGLIEDNIYSSLCVSATAFSAIWLLITMIKTRKSENKKIPFSCYRLSVCILVIGLFILCTQYLDWWFGMVKLNEMIKEVTIILGICSIDFIICNLIFKNKRLYK